MKKRVLIWSSTLFLRKRLPTMLDLGTKWRRNAMLKNDFVRRLREVFQRFLGLKNKETEAEIKGSFFRPILFLFPNILKESISSDDDINDWQKDYLSKNKNIEKYLFDGCEALQIIGISYSKYKRELARYSDGELNQKTGKIVGRNFEIEARLALRDSSCELSTVGLECYILLKHKRGGINSMREARSSTGVAH